MKSRITQSQFEIPSTSYKIGSTATINTIIRFYVKQPWSNLTLIVRIIVSKYMLNNDVNRVIDIRTYIDYIYSGNVFHGDWLCFNRFLANIQDHFTLTCIKITTLWNLHIHISHRESFKSNTFFRKTNITLKMLNNYPSLLPRAIVNIASQDWMTYWCWYIQVRGFNDFSIMKHCKHIRFIYMRVNVS